MSLQDNFKEVVPALKPKEAVDEANRCLFCYDAPCVQACPTGINIPSFIKKITTDNLLGSALTILDSNPLGASCARVCPTSELCEGACVLNGPAASKAIQIGLLQRHATDWAMENTKPNTALFKTADPNGKKIAIVGAGPAGLSAARDLARLGYLVTVYEAKPRAGGLNAYGIVSFRLPEDVVAWEVEQIEALGVQFCFETKIGEDVSAQDLLDNHDSVILAAGMGYVPALNIEGEDLQGVLDAVQFVEDTKTKPLTNHLLGKKVAVIGAGNTAIDAATCSTRLGADNVKILYRRTVAEMTAYEFEYEFAKNDGVEFRWLVAPTRILGENGRVTGLQLIRMELGEPDERGRRRPREVAGSEFTLELDFVIKAIGQTRQTHLIDAFQLQHEHGIPLVESGTYRTSQPNVFAIGDFIFKTGKTDAMVVTAVQQGKDAAVAVHTQLTSQKVQS
ncbi:NAD(P)-dependent oxidoreductase [Tumebacillus sp. ITR2]|uniref:NAD(P)-dependent oxidoreductase n=1 Tax=Tumebacillus amylolyticus TaxID=2801339 RepID=A0ABS1JGU3_9BACL|nr:NAD(P)-dependent oxidoreductase [Tumebacillus amylolyticus]MBL0389457.1 NAD(P)-dependent oxidoreductase [Tumebacillus amylolyticus]